MGTKRHSVTVCDAEFLSPKLRRLRFEGRTLRGVKWTPGDKVKLRIRGKSRSYTPSAMSSVEGWIDVIFFLHGNGPGSRWAAGAEVGTSAVLSRPEKSIKRYKNAPEWAIFLGDETTLGLANALLSSLPAGTPISGAIEIGLEDAHAVAKLRLPLAAETRMDHYGDALINWVARTPLPQGRGLIWIAGESVTVRTLKRMLDAPDGCDAKIKTKSYWKSSHRHVSNQRTLTQIAAK